MSPIGVGFLKMDSEGRFHAQRLHLRPEFQCASEGASGSTGLSPLAPAEQQVELGKILERSEIALIWVGTGADPAAVRRALEAGQHVLCGLPLIGTADDWRDLLSTALGTGPRVFFAALQRWDSRLLTVHALVRGGSLGSIIELRRFSRQYIPDLSVGAAAERAALESRSPAGQPTGSMSSAGAQTFQLKWLEILDELLQLVPSAASSVRAVSARSGRSVWVTFADGCHAHIEIDRLSLSPLETGWILEGTTGGYASGRRFRVEADYELVDVPVEDLPTDQDGFYNSLVSTIRDGRPFAVANDSILRVLVLRDAIESSLCSGLAVDVSGDC